MIIKYKNNNKTFYKIQLSYTCPRGKRYQPKFAYDKKGLRVTSQRMAKQLEFEYLTELKSSLDNSSVSKTFEEWHVEFLSYIKRSYKHGTFMQYDGDLKKWLTIELREKKLKDIKRSDIDAFIFKDMASNKATPHTQKKTRRTLSRIFEVAIDEGLITKNPCKGITVKVPPPVKQVLNSKEVDIFLSASKDLDHPFYYLWCFALFSGLRTGELYSLRWKHIDEVTGLINISTQWTNKDGLHATKSNTNRNIPISPCLNELILQLKNIGPFKENLVGLNGKEDFVGDLILPRIKQWRHGDQSKITKEFCKSLGITGITFHDLRATFITNLLIQGISIPTVMRIVGHTRISTTNQYLRLAGVEVKGATDKLSYSLPQKTSGSILSFKKS